MHALNKRYALNTEVRLTTRVYGIRYRLVIDQPITPNEWPSKLQHALFDWLKISNGKVRIQNVTKRFECTVMLLI